MKLKSGEPKEKLKLTEFAELLRQTLVACIKEYLQANGGG